jgi:hypothetical protein
MEYSCVQLNDLPDEILMIIFKKLANSEVLYSLLGVNKRLNKIAHDSVFTNDLSLLTFTWDGLVYSLPDPILDRFCLHILPKIHQNIKWLHLDSQSMELGMQRWRWSTGPPSTGPPSTGPPSTGLTGPPSTGLTGPPVHRPPVSPVHRSTVHRSHRSTGTTGLSSTGPPVHRRYGAP